jgi:hypothetical protein
VEEGVGSGRFPQVKPKDGEGGLALLKAVTALYNRRAWSVTWTLPEGKISIK